MTAKSIKHNVFTINKMFEEELCEYTGAPYCIATDSCTSAILLCLLYHEVKGKEVIVPKHTYLSVPQMVIIAGGIPVFKRIKWSGCYALNPYPIVDSAKRLTSDMYVAGEYQCLSFHIKKLLPIGKGGAVLTDDPKFVEWAKMMRYEGRSEKNYIDDNVFLTGYNFYMSPESAARGLNLLMNYPLHVKDQDERGGLGYKDLTQMPVFFRYT